MEAWKRWATALRSYSKGFFILAIRGADVLLVSRCNSSNVGCTNKFLIPTTILATFMAIQKKMTILNMCTSLFIFHVLDVQDLPGRTTKNVGNGRTYENNFRGEHAKIVSYFSEVPLFEELRHPCLSFFSNSCEWGSNLKRFYISIRPVIHSLFQEILYTVRSVIQILLPLILQEKRIQIEGKSLF